MSSSMTGRDGSFKGAPWLFAAAFLFAGTAEAAAPAEWGQALRARLRLVPIVLDYELPGHPRELGRGHAGTIGTVGLVWSVDRFLTVEAGVLARIPFAQDFAEETDAFPQIALTLWPFGPNLSLRLGALDIHHGHHPAVLDEARYAYGRPYQELYNRSIEVERDVGEDPFLPVENGFQLRAAVDYLSAEVYLDWQLLETLAHREKFAVGVLGRFESKWVDAGFEYRLVHYGGQLFTAKREGFDPKRQPTTLAARLKARPLILDYVTVELAGAFIHGRVVQAPEEPESAHWGVEAGADVLLFQVARLGYRAWLPKQNVARYVSEDGDPVYAGPRSHRATVGLFGKYGIAELSGRLDLIFADGADKVQYQTLTTLTFVWEPLLFTNFDYP